MITSGDVEFEVLGQATWQRPILKTVRVAPNVVAMTAGDAGFQADAIQELRKHNPSNESRPVRDIAMLYLDFVNQTKQRLAVTRVLASLGLNNDTFISRQREMNDDFVQRVTSEIWKIEIGADTIFTGVDPGGSPHIYTIIGDDFRCDDSIGFSAIGYGARHAESQFMLGKHSRNALPTETLLLTYIAKKRSEVAPGVGRETDMFWLSRNEGFKWFTQDHQIKPLQAIYDQLEKEQEKAFERAGSTWRDALAEMTRNAQIKYEEQKQALASSGAKPEEKPKPAAPTEQASSEEEGN